MIFWKHVKLMSEAGIYGFFRFEATDTTNTITNTPKVWLQNVSTWGSQSAQPLGYLLTTDINGGYILNPFEFRNTVEYWNTLTCKPSSSSSNKLTISQIVENSSFTSDFTSTGNIKFTVPAAKSFEIYQGSNAIFSTGSSGISIAAKLTVNELESTGACTADYFNATSDYRAKKDFKPLKIDALSLINKIQPYTFKYKDSNLPSVGIIAQDVQDVDLEGFKLVDNENATGENMDYMSIHESKLIYILWKAIQEQQQEIEELKAQLKK